MRKRTGPIIRLPQDLVDAVKKYQATDWKDGRDPSKIGALNAVAFIGERTSAVIGAALLRRATKSRKN